MELENIMLSERGHTQKAIYFMISFIRNMHYISIESGASHCQGLGTAGLMGMGFILAW